jgi:hypothetical protein
MENMEDLDMGGRLLAKNSMSWIFLKNPILSEFAYDKGKHVHSDKRRRK